MMKISTLGMGVYAWWLCREFTDYRCHYWPQNIYRHFENTLALQRTTNGSAATLYLYAEQRPQKVHSLWFNTIPDLKMSRPSTRSASEVKRIIEKCMFCKLNDFVLESKFSKSRGIIFTEPHNMCIRYRTGGMNISCTANPSCY